MQSLIVGILQLDQNWQNKAANFERVLSQVKPDLKLDLLLLPEMFHTGFSMQTTLADHWMHSEALDFLKTLSTDRDLAIYTSIMVQDNGKFFNRGVFIDPNGCVVVYDKRKAFGLGGEDKHFTTGNSEVIVNCKNWRFNLQICYDLRFPELSRNYIQANGDPAYDVLLYVANWPQRRIGHWDALLKARAIENQCYVLACNRVGDDGNSLFYNGHSQAIDLYGNNLSGPHEQEGLFVVHLSKDALLEGRNSLPFLKDA